MRFAAAARVPLAVLLVAATALPALAGPPLVCHPLDIGGARSLPWDTDARTWKGVRANYDRSALVGDTLALLTPTTPVIVRMETLRRAAIYASDDATAAKELLITVLDRAHAKGADSLAAFDAGYLVETCRQLAAIAPALGPMVGDKDGYALVKKALSARGPDPAIEFAAALIQAGHRKPPAGNEHVRAARAGVDRDVLLAKNVKMIED
jgi:hypothetical protein